MVSLWTSASAASDDYYKAHGCRPSDEELRDLTGLSEYQIRKVRDWYRINNPKPPDAVDWQNRNRKQDIEDAANHDPDDDEDPLARVPA